jgi:peptide/nickel transport system substrate-binding protein
LTTTSFLTVTLALLAACVAQPGAVSIVQTVEVEKVVEVEKEVVVTATPSPGGGQIIYALYQEPEILNPYIATQTASGEANSPVIEGLLSVDPDGNFYPVLAEEVPTVENGLVSEDGLQITYNLKQDVLWSDGQPFTCADVVHTYRSIIHPLSGAVSTTGYVNITPPKDIATLMENPEAEVEEDPSDGGGVVCLDDHTVQITFAEFYAAYLSMFDAIMPAHATGAPANMQKWVYNWHPVGTGPFKIQEWVSGDHITYIPNENYRDYPDKPKLDKLIVRIIPSREVGKALIRTGEIDILWDLTEADVPEFEDVPEVVVNLRPSPGTERLVLNLANPELDATDDPVNNPHWALGDLRVRQAIQYAIDKEFINQQLLYGLAKVGTNELNNGWAKVELEPSPYDPDQAATLLEEAGWIDEDGDGVRECHACLYAEEGRPLRLKIQTTTGNKLREETEQIILEMLAEVGIELYIENVPSAVLFGSWASGAFRKHGQFDILMYTTSDGVDPQSQIEGYFASSAMPLEANTGAGFNYSRWVNEEADQLIAAAGATPDLETRKELYRQVMEIISAELPHIYLYDRADIHLSRARVQNFKVNSWANQSWNTEDWAVAE